MMSLEGKILLNRYRVDEFLGRGGMAEVYKVWDSQRMVHLAMKVLNPDMAEDKIFLRRFQREARTLAKLEHPHIIRFHGLYQDGNIAFILMEFVDGDSLRTEIFKQKAPLPLARVAKVMRTVCSALYYAHHNGVVHCDIKPANIMVDSSGSLRLADFGIARMADGGTSSLAGAGSPPYMAPEQIKGREPTPQTDVYALGVVLYEMLTGGERPFTGNQASIQGSTKMKILWEHTNIPAPSPRKWNPNIPSNIEAIVLKALEKNPVDRFRDTASFWKTFDAALKGEDVKLAPAKNPQQEEFQKTSRTMSKAVPVDTTSLKSQFTRENVRAVSKIWGAMFLIFLCLLLPLLFVYYQNSSQPFSPSQPLATLTSTTSPSLYPSGTMENIPTHTPYPTYTLLLTAISGKVPTYTPYPTYTLLPTAISGKVPTYTPYPTHTLLPTSTSRKAPTYTPYPTYTSLPTATKKAAPTYTPYPTYTLAPTDTPHPTETPVPATVKPPPQWSEVEIFADQGWQDTGVKVETYQVVEIIYFSGEWTEWTGVVNLHGPVGISNYICGAEHCCEPMPYELKGSLIGKIGDELFVVGDNISFSPAKSGTLYLRINDCDGSANLGDNVGFLNIKISR